MTTPFETITVDTKTVGCSGSGGAVGGHPLVYLNLSPAGQAECPYCSRLFVYEASKDGSAHAH
ncbi:MAG TPA: zinc-finger domain-containing protein [Aliidongia sp.]|uniref:zinc-finger domain-containing protein n=1 Tax=Aliidongia sp. TaxID=1914230 RepID=UPI002DDDAB2E|nr:zinc-finger domain-containing protein [Aliidongia sp.]HEV2678142.1 zinc-finger domain-containing protein [Aliidongia sp.]